MQIWDWPIKICLFSYGFPLLIHSFIIFECKMFAKISIIFAFLFEFPHQCNFWQLLEQPIQLAKPNKDGIYEFDLIVDYRMSMTLKWPNGTTPILDYSPENMEWTQRDPNMWTECGRKWILANKSAEAEELLASLVQMDGRHRLMNALNGFSPGPTLVVPLGAKVVMRIKNRLHSQALTIHLHGMDKRDRWWTDGVPFLQQCPIFPGSDYSYRFIADTPGTHWYHGHLMADRASGLVGGFVVLRPNERKEIQIEESKKVKKIVLKIGREYLAIVQDLTPTDSTQIYLDRMNWRKKWIGHSLDKTAENGCERVERTFDGTLSRELPVSAILIGGKGWHNQTDIRQRPFRLPLTNFPIKPGAFLWIEGHQFFVVAVDGSQIKPIKVKNLTEIEGISKFYKIDSLLIFSGERYDILVKGLKRPNRNEFGIIFELMEQFYEKMPNKWAKREPTIGLAFLNYNFTELSNKTEKNVDWAHSQCTGQNKCLVLNCPFAKFPPWANLSCIHADSLENDDKLDGAELMSGNENIKEIFANLHDGLNGWRYVSPKGIPYFLQKGDQQKAKKAIKECDPEKCDRWAEDSAWNPNCQCFIHFEFPLGQIVQIVAVSAGGMAHPFHLHGTKFFIIGMGFAEQYSSNGTIKGLNRHLECAKPANNQCVEMRWANGTMPTELAKNPVPRDTIVVPAKGYVIIRFWAINPGWFFAHCHLLMHSMDGMNFAFKIGKNEEIPAPPFGFPQNCGIYEEEETIPDKILREQQKFERKNNGVSFYSFPFFCIFYSYFVRFFFIYYAE